MAVCQVTVRHKPTPRSQTPIAVPIDTSNCLQGCLSVYLYTPLLPLPPQTCCVLTPTDLSLAVLLQKVPEFAPGPLADVPQSSLKLLQCCPPRIPSVRFEARLHAIPKPCLHRVRDRAYSLVLCKVPQRSVRGSRISAAAERSQSLHRGP